jgi:catechol 2,3-dioxygenase-like lactoylglutathione lyase family enzyme
LAAEETLMIHHVSIGVRNIANAKTFYDAALQPLGYSCLSSSASSLGYGKDAVAFWISATNSPVVADPNSGLHFCVAAPSRKSVDDFHKAALAAGGQDNGKAGLRTDYGANYYAAYATDPDGYRIEAYYDRAR